MADLFMLLEQWIFISGLKHISKDSSGRLIRFEFCLYCPWEYDAHTLDYKFHKSLSPLGNHIL